MTYYGFFDTVPESPSYKKLFNVARIQLPPNPMVSQRWNKDKKDWVDDNRMIGKATGLEDGLDFREISEAQANSFIKAA
jgi:hypothetical protein